MIKLITILLFFLFSINAFAGDAKLDAIFKKYDGKKNITTVNVTKDMFGLFMQMDNSEQKDESVKRALSKMDQIKIMNYTADSLQNISKSLYNEIKNSISLNEYKELMIINDGDSNVKMLIKKNGDIITDFIMLSEGLKEVVLISISGQLDLDALRKVSKSMNIKGMQDIDENAIKGK